MLNKSKKGLPLETKNTQNHENRRLGLIESLHMQHCSLRGCIRPLKPVAAAEQKFVISMQFIFSALFGSLQNSREDVQKER